MEVVLPKSAFVSVGPFPVLNGDADDVTRYIAQGRPQSGPQTAFALHVGGLNHRRNQEFTDAMRRATAIYADGTSVVLLAWLAGGVQVRRAATTDIGIPILQSRAEMMGRALRVAIVGGRAGVASEAGRKLKAAAQCEIVLVAHGFQQNWHETLGRLGELAPDVVIVGLGMPLEAVWVDQHRSTFPDGSLVMTCGGWLNFLAAGERRAPKWIRILGLEWAHRLALSPRRLGRRYALGMITVLGLALAQLRGIR